LKRFLLSTSIFYFVFIGFVSGQEKNLYLFDLKKKESFKIQNDFKFRYQLLKDTVEKSQKFIGVINDSIIKLKNENININNISFIRKATDGQLIKKGFGGLLLGLGSYLVIWSLYDMGQHHSHGGEEWNIHGSGASALFGVFIAFPGYVMIIAKNKKYSMGQRYKLKVK
jgi:hypothetical protein